MIINVVSSAAGIALVWPCDPLEKAAVSIIAFGCITVLIGSTCCCFAFRIKGFMAFLLCFMVGVLLLLAFAAAATESSFALGDIDNYKFTRNGSRIDECRYYDDNATLPVALVMVSFVFVFLTVFYFIATCFNALTGTNQNSCLYSS